MSLTTPYALNRFRLLGRSGLRVSPLCLGTMTFGTEWGWGTKKDDAREIFDRYAERGGNFIDTANLYTNGTSETFLGEFLQGQREQFVLATKYTLNARAGDPNAGGNHRKNMMQSVEASLRRLQTDFIDLYWVHAWDQITPIEEVMRALDDLVRSGKVLYVGISDMPAWKVAQANTLASLRGWSPFIGLQIEYSLVERTVERELVPMALDLGLGITPWSPLAGGILTGKYGPQHRKKADEKPAEGKMPSRIDFLQSKLTDQTFATIDVVKAVAAETSRTTSQVALNWLLQKPGVTSIILGARTLAQLDDNLGCLEFKLSADQMRRLDEVSRIAPGFPMEFLNSPMVNQIVNGGVVIER